MIETAAERAALASVWGDTLTTDAGACVPGQYVEPQADDQFVEGTSPTFYSSLYALTNASIGLRTTALTVETHYNQARGPFKVVGWEVQDDGAYVLLRLQQV